MKTEAGSSGGQSFGLSALGRTLENEGRTHNSEPEALALRALGWPGKPGSWKMNVS